MDHEYSFEGIETIYGLDKKQKNAFRLICSSMVLRLLSTHPHAESILSAKINVQSTSEINEKHLMEVDIKLWLESFGAVMKR